MIALHRAGRSPEALERYAEHVRRLDEELGLEPGAELRELQVAILRHEPALAAWPRPASWTGAAQIHTPEAVAEAAVSEEPVSSLVGRARETRVLDELLADVRGGATRWLVLTGPAGIGKTRLAEELVARMRAAGGRDAWARCSEEDGAPAWWPIRQLVRALGDDPDTLLVPPAGVDADAARFAVYERVAALRAGRRRSAQAVVSSTTRSGPIPTSARCLAHLAGALRGTPVVFALTLRDGEAADAIAPLLAALARSEGIGSSRSGRSRDAEVGVLAGAIAGEELSEREAGELARRTGGNPLFVCEYARLPSEAREQGDTPLAVRSVLGRRLAGLEPEILQVLRAAAIIGDVVDLPALDRDARDGRRPRRRPARRGRRRERARAEPGHRGLRVRARPAARRGARRDARDAPPAPARAGRLDLDRRRRRSRLPPRAAPRRGARGGRAGRGGRGLPRRRAGGGGALELGGRGRVVGGGAARVRPPADGRRPRRAARRAGRGAGPRRPRPDRART